MNLKIEELKFDADGLIPAVIQDYKTKDVLMLVYMNEEAIVNTLATGYATFWSRTYDNLWRKGRHSGNVQIVESIIYDCNKDSLLLIVRQIGVACRRGNWSCFDGAQTGGSVTDQAAEQIAQRKSQPMKESYTTYLFKEGIDKILEKVSEASAEVAMAAKKEGTEELAGKMSDLLYYALVLMAEKDVSVDDIRLALKKRMEGKY